VKQNRPEPRENQAAKDESPKPDSDESQADDQSKEGGEQESLPEL